MPEKQIIESDNEDRDSDARAVGFKELLSEIGGSTAFSIDSLVRQISNCEDRGQDFIIFHQGTKFKVPLARINEFFVEYEKPDMPLSLEEENLVLRKKLVAAEKAMAEKGLSLKADKKQFTVQEAVGGIAPTKPSIRDPLHKAAKTAIPKPTPEPVVAPGEKPKKMELSEIQADLKKDLVGKKAVNARGLMDKGATLNPAVAAQRKD